LTDARNFIQDVCSEHLFAVDANIKDPQLRSVLAQEIKHECQELIEYIEAAKRFNLEVNSRSKDRVISFGEKLSCRYMTYMLRDRVWCPLARVMG